MPNKGFAKIKAEWVSWLKSYGAGKLFESILRNVQGAESECVHCGQKIYLDIVEGGGVPDWGSIITGVDGLDYGCPASPDSDSEGTGSHYPVRLP